MYSIFIKKTSFLPLYFITDCKNRYLCLRNMAILSIEEAITLLPSADVYNSAIIKGKLLATFDSVEELLQNHPELLI